MKGKTSLLLCVTLLIIITTFTACGAQPAASVPPPVEQVAPLAAPPGAPVVNITLHPENPGNPIPPDFLGLSFDSPDLAEGYFDESNQPLVNLLSNLGKGVMVFGAEGLEFTYWPRTIFWRLQYWGAHAALAPTDIDKMLAFARKTGWKVIFGLNLGANRPDMAADIAEYAARAGKDSLLAFEIGNEPDLYYRNGLRPQSYSYEDYRREFSAYLKALRERVPDAPVAGPVSATTIAWFSSFVRDEGKNITLATNHYYPLNAYPNVPPNHEMYASIENLLSVNTMKRTTDVIRRFKTTADQYGLPLRYDETNSSYPAKDGLGDTFAAALWSADYLFNLAENGVTGANFFSRFACGGYTPICVDWKRDYHAQPLYYGLLLFHHAAQGRIVPVETGTPINVTAHATLADDGALRAVIINKTANQSVNCRIQTGTSYSRAGAFRLVARSTDAKEGITFAGSEATKDGTWFPRAEEQVKPDGAAFQVAVPAASAVVVTFR